MSFYVVAAGIACLVKFWILYSYRAYGWGSAGWMAFVSCLALFNLSELGIYLMFEQGLSQDRLLSAYYVLCGWSLVFGSLYSSDNNLQRCMCGFLAVAALVFTFLFIGTDKLVIGYTIESLPVKTLKGDWYFTFQSFVMLALGCMYGFLIYNYRACRDAAKQVFYMYSIIGMTFLFFASAAINCLMILGFDANGSGILPVCTTIFLLATAFGRNLDSVGSDPRVIDPSSEEHKARKKIAWIHSQFSMEKMTFKEAISMTEKVLIQSQLNKNSGNKMATAKDLKMDRKTLYNKLNKIQFKK